eukprot:symbB.v1.2.025218.t2/scaffold2438.1/size79063/3
MGSRRCQCIVAFEGAWIPLGPNNDPHEACPVRRTLELAVHLQPVAPCVLISRKFGSPTVVSLPQVFLSRWHCAWSSGARTRAVVVSYTGSTSVLSCAWPLEMPSLSTVSLEREDDSAWNLVDLQVQVLPPGPSKLLAACAAPFSGMWRYQQVLEQWLEYHRLLRMDFFLYDYDGSLQDAVASFQRRDGGSQVFYISSFAKLIGKEIDYVANARPEEEHYGGPFFFRDLLEPLANAHCLFKSRGEYDFLLFLHRHDEYFLPSWYPHMRTSLLPLKDTSHVGRSCLP